MNNNQVNFPDFQKLNFKIGTVISVEKVPEADKLLKFIFDLGDEKRQIMAGMAPFFTDPSKLVGKQMPILTNIEPRKFMGYESQGMILAGDVEGKPILLHPEKEVPPGTIIK